MKKYFYIIIAIFLMNIGSIYAESNKIILNDAKTNDVNHTFEYPNLEISNDVNPHSLTLSIENGYFLASDNNLNNEVETYFNFMGGTNLSNAYIATLNTTEKFKVITFNLKDTIDLTDTMSKENVISSIRNFMRNIIFYNNENQDAKFTLTFSEVELKLNDPNNLIEDIRIVVFKDPNQPKEHYYAKIEADEIEWTDAYNIASTLKFNNLQGYLVTITSEEEHNFIYQSLGPIRGWMGAASVQNADSYSYNTKNIPWVNATSKLDLSVGRGEGTEENENKIKTYWHWVAGPEAGKKVFADGAYFNFADFEPNNFNVGEWCGEYGHGDGGVWNDYPNYYDDIQGYYVEFGGFDNDDETVKPVSLVNTFKWKDYDIRNIEYNIGEEIDKHDFEDEVTEEEINEIIDKAIENTGLENITYEVLDTTLVDNILNIKIEVTIGEGTDAVKYTLNIQKDISPKVENPKTGDNIISYIIIGSISLISLVGCIFYLKHKTFN